MLEPLTLTGDGCSPWPPALQFTPEVESGIRAATQLAFGADWDTTSAEQDLEILAHDLIRYAPDLVRQLMAIAGQEEL